MRSEDGQSPAWWKILLGFLALALAFHAEKVLLGPAGPIRVHDVFDSEFPRYMAQARELLSRGFAEWYPNLAGGLPAFASHFAPYFPLALLTAALGAWVVYASLCVLGMTAAGYGMYRLTHELLGVHPAPALLTGVLMAYGSQVQHLSLAIHVMLAAFPLVTVWMLLDVARPGGRPLVAAGAFAVLGLSYPILSFPFFLLQVLLMEALRRERTDLISRRAFWTIWVAYAVAQAPMVYSLLTMVPLSQRVLPAAPASFAATLPGLPAEIVRIARSLSATTLLLPLVAMALTTVARDRRQWLALGLLAFGAGVGGFAAVRPGMYLLGPTPLRHLDLVHLLGTLPFSCALAGALAMDSLRRDSRGAVAVALAAGAGLLGTMELVAGTSQASQVLERGWGLMAAAGLVLATRSGPPSGRLGWPTLVVLGLAVALAFPVVRRARAIFEDHTYAATYAAYAPLAELRERHEGGPFRVGCLAIHPTVAQLHGLETLGGRGPLMNRRFKDLFALAVEPQLSQPALREDFRLYWYHLLLRDPRRPVPPRLDLDVLRLLNVHYLVMDHGAQASPEEVLEPVLTAPGRDAGAPQVTAYRVPGAFPRAFFTPGSQVLPDDAAVLRAIAEAGGDALASTAFFAAEGAPVGLATGGGEALGPVDFEEAAEAVEVVRSAGHGHLEVRGTAPREGFVVVVENYDHRFQALLGGEPARVYRADHAFMAIPVPRAGPFELVLEFRDPWLRPLVGLSLASYLGMFLALLGAGRRVEGEDR